MLQMLVDFKIGLEDGIVRAYRKRELLLLLFLLMLLLFLILLLLLFLLLVVVTSCLVLSKEGMGHVSHWLS